MARTNSSTVPSILASAVFVMAGTTAAAADAEGEHDAAGSAEGRAVAALEEIVVTAQKREQKLIEVPISITALSGEALKDRGISNAQDLSFVVPAMSVAETGPGRQIITVRGLGSQRGTSSLTGVYLDEMPVSGLQDGFIASYLDVRPVDLERVEVLKGPQGTLFGEGSVGGTLRFVTRDPQLDRFEGEGSASLSHTEDGDWSEEVGVIVNVPVVDNRFALRIAGTYENKSGWIDKVASASGDTPTGPVIEENFNDNEGYHLRAKALWTPTDKLIVKGMAVINRSDGGGSNIVNLKPRSESYFVQSVFPTAPSGYSDEYALYNLTATYDLGFADLLSSTSYADTDSRASLAQRRPIIPNPNPGVQEILTRDYSQSGTLFSQELRLTSSGSGPLEWTLGAFYKEAELARTFVSGTDVRRFGIITAQRSQAGSKPANKSDSAALFADVSYALTPSWEVGGGVRYFEDDRESFDANAANVAATFLSGTFDATTFRVYTSYAFTDDVRVYASVADGFRSGGFNSTAAIGRGAPATYDPETTTSYELGTKMLLLDGRLSVDLAVFYSEYLDIQLDTVRDPGGTPLQFTANPGEAEMQGCEWVLQWAVTDRLTVGLNGDVIDTEITKIDRNVPNNPVFLGDPIDFVPEYSWGVSFDYGFDWSASVAGTLRLQYDEQGKSAQSFRSIDSPVTQEFTPVLNFLSASVGAEWGGWDVDLFGRNLLNEDGALRPGSGLHPQARPRTFGVSFRKSF